MSRSLGVTTVMILAALERGVRYGLDIVNRTELLPGTVYTTLRRLERRGRYYELTPAGAEALETAVERFEAMGVDVAGGISTAG